MTTHTHHTPHPHPYPSFRCSATLRSQAISHIHTRLWARTKRWVVGGACQHVPHHMHTAVVVDVAGDVQCGTVTVSQTLRAKVASGHRNPGWVNFTCTRQRHKHTTPASNIEQRDDTLRYQQQPMYSADNTRALQAVHGAPRTTSIERVQTLAARRCTKGRYTP